MKKKEAFHANPSDGKTISMIALDKHPLSQGIHQLILLFSLRKI